MSDGGCMGELIFLGIVMAVCAYFYTLTFGFAVSILDKSGGAAVFPRFVILFLAVFLVVRFITVLREKQKKPFAFKELFTGMRLFFFVSLIGYILALKHLGYLICTLAFLMVTVNVFYYKTKNGWGPVKSIVLRNVLLAVFTLAMNYFFVRILHIMLPSGFLPQLF